MKFLSSIIFIFSLLFIIELTANPRVDNLNNKVNFNKKVNTLNKVISIYFRVSSLYWLYKLYFSNGLTECDERYYGTRFYVDGLVSSYATLCVDKLNKENDDLEKQIKDLELIE